MNERNDSQTIKPVKLLETTLPDPLALFVGIRTGPDGLYETPSEYIRDLIRHDMEAWKEQEQHEFYETVFESMDSPLSKLDDDFFDQKRKELKEMQNAKANGKE